MTPSAPVFVVSGMRGSIEERTCPVKAAEAQFRQRAAPEESGLSARACSVLSAVHFPYQCHGHLPGAGHDIRVHLVESVLPLIFEG